MTANQKVLALVGFLAIANLVLLGAHLFVTHTFGPIIAVLS